MPAENNSIISVKNLNIRFTGPQPFHAVQDVSFEIAAGETLALIGQSGSGKSLTSLALMGLLPKNANITGSLRLNDSTELAEMPANKWSEIRGNKIGMIFQEPMTALNPVKTCGYQLIESIQTHQQSSAKEAKEKAIQWFEKVKLPNPAELLKRYPHQLSGGQKQRVMIAMAMCNHPSLLIADEPTTALDVTVQKEIVQLMKDLQAEFNTAMLFITHDIALARTITGNFLVLEKGKILHSGFPQINADKLNKEIHIREERPILKVENLEVIYPQNTNWLGKTTSSVTAVDKVSFELYKGETLGLVGESGCGKSTLSKTILGLQAPTFGNIIFENQNITGFSSSQWRKLRKDIQIIFQDPYASLNQRMRIGDALSEPMLVHKLADKHNVEKHVDELLEMVQLPREAAFKYPHEFSGGQRQRICIARALAVQPKLIICDESVAALDVHIQEQILELLVKLQKEKELTYLFITHDLNVVKRISNRIMVMQKGIIVEEGNTEEILEHPKMAYTRKLLDAVLG
ncbi:ABC transporter ATP-binding protein [Taibaiella lutea]|uniref:ABC transporter ATP-binding protein n=1 Tax=Taibaiella lutea TaxID=2608001 RepID=A0A5M6CFB2_9BACT|nr:ABC transporter ATP-binding protein [Taibaiella lutea]KAA5533643.1 ABC transporter ATP-binding protein [Taibaiella lutea]